ncbi:MAG TPA: Mur ligase family protein [Acidimicrobiales bacterium]|nr:Mur ligase family protein [Acidimicrobiales bacterium]
MELAEALEYLAGHVNLEREVAPRAAARRLDRVRRLMELMGDPQHSYPVIHITGTNGKGSVARMVTALLVARGLRAGTYTSPHLERVNERMAWNGDPIPDDDLADVIGAVAHLERLLESPPTHFEILTAAAFRWFADVAVDVAVVEVGLGGRWDATNVADAQVAVLTNVSLDHAETIGPHLTDIATEKAGIVKPGATFVLGETNPSLRTIFEAAGAAELWVKGTEFRCGANRLAHDGRVVDLYTPAAAYEGVYLPVHGPYQGDNAAAALAAVEAFFGAPLAPEVVAEAFAGLQLPGRLEVVSRHPVTVLDGAHNPAGALAATAALDEAFGPAVSGRVLVIGMLQGRDPIEMLQCFDAGRARLVVACPPPSPRALPPAEVAAAARALGTDAEETASVGEAVATALALAGEQDLVHVTGSLYVVGAARAALHTA